MSGPNSFTPRSAVLLAMVALTMLVVAAPRTFAQDGEELRGGGSLPHGKEGERELRAYETQTIGAEHAQEHARERRALRRQLRHWRRMRPAQRRRALAARHRRDLKIAHRSIVQTGPPAAVGSWTTAPFPIPNYAIHSAVLPTGKVLFWGYDAIPPVGGRSNIGLAALWDPAKGTGPASMKSVPPPLIDADGDGTLEPTPIYCSGQSFLPNGELLVTGGNQIWPYHAGDAYDEYSGLNTVLTFDPWRETWKEQPRMHRGRWYPTQVELGDGRTVIASGYTEEAPGAVYNPEVEVFTSGQATGSVGSVVRQPTADRTMSYYPHLHTLPSGNVLLAGPDYLESAILNTQTFTWQNLAPANTTRVRSPSVLIPQGPSGTSTVMQIGGWDDRSPPDASGFYPATATTESIDASQPAPAWTLKSPLNVARGNENAVLLPDGSMVVVGGGSGTNTALGGYVTHADGSARQVELWDPATRTWRLGPAQLEDRTYHSTAVLLPDGRVMSGGDDYHPPEYDQWGPIYSTSDTAEIYSPPYLFQRGARPTIRRAPATIAWGQKFTVGVRAGPTKKRKGKGRAAASKRRKKSKKRKVSKVARAVLMAPDATTHALDMQQRHVELTVTRKVKGVGLELQAPPAPNVAPPGYYMLFVLNTRGVPSVARWVKLQSMAPASRQKPRKKRKAGKRRGRGGR